MAELTNVDIQAQEILDGLDALVALLDQPMTREALDLAKNAKTAAQYDILQRVRRSLTQYLQRDGDLFYVGLLGHFSSGKSSTINSILGVWKTDQERETGLNPTDTTITLVTRHRNVRSLLGIIREGHVVIRYQALDNPILDNIVLADTPGTGDPHLIEEIARDFLPICDVILFFFSAASPLDQTDMPLLMELHKRLMFIPIRFVVTRADELRLDFSKPVSEKNIDGNKRSRFFSEVLTRINKLLQPSKPYTEESFILIDNKEHYNIDELTALLKARCDPSNPHSRIIMHSHKLRYFVQAAKELRTFFSEFIDDKLRQLNRVVSTSEENIQRYNENVRISNSNLTKNWLDQLSAIHASHDAALNRLAIPEQLPTEIWGFEVVTKRHAEIGKTVAFEASRIAENVNSRYKKEICTAVHDQITQFSLSSFLERSGRYHDVPRRILLTPLKIEQDIHLPLIPASLISGWASLREAMAVSLREAAANLRKTIEDAARLLEERAPLRECEQEVSNAQQSLAKDLTEFFRNAELYRAGVFSHTTKESIATLGIGAQLDALESEFTEGDRTRFTDETLHALFPKFPEITASTLTELTALEKALRPIIAESKDLKIPSPDVSPQCLSSVVTSERSSLFSSIIAELQDDVGRLLSNLK